MPSIRMSCTRIRGLSDAYGSWKTIWNSARRRRSRSPRSAVSAVPSKSTSPALGRMSCRMPLPAVVLPQPDSPTSASVRPGRIASETPSTART